jgi:hypothetical protein
VKGLIGRACTVLFVCASLHAGAASEARAQDGVSKPRSHETKRVKRARRAAKAEGASETPPPRPHKRPRRRDRDAVPTTSDIVATPTVPAARGRESRSPSASASAAAEAAKAAASGVNAEIVKEGDTSVKVMKFEGLGIEGRLKSPQLVYFVQRVRAEFDRPTLAHRSFMPELQSASEREPMR